MRIYLWANTIIVIIFWPLRKDSDTSCVTYALTQAYTSLLTAGSGLWWSSLTEYKITKLTKELNQLSRAE